MYPRELPRREERYVRSGISGFQELRPNHYETKMVARVLTTAPGGDVLVSRYIYSLGHQA